MLFRSVAYDFAWLGMGHFYGTAALRCTAPFDEVVALHKGVQNQFVVGTKSLWVSERLQDELIVRNNVAFELWAPDVRMAFVDDFVRQVAGPAIAAEEMVAE